MTTGNNVWANVSGIANAVQEDALFVIRERSLMLANNLVTTYTDMTGMNPRKFYQYESVTAGTLLDSTDLTSQTFTPSLLSTLTPAEIGAQIFITDAVMESDLPANFRNDAAVELGLAASSKIDSDLVGALASFTGGTIGAAGTVITWSYMAAAIEQARNANKSANVPLVAVIHGYQAAVLAKAASVAGASVVNGQNIQNEMTAAGFSQAFVFNGVPIYKTYVAADGNSDFTGAVYPRSALAMDWRRAIRVEPERDASRRGLELNMSGVYGYGVIRPLVGVKFIFDATAPTA